MKWLVLFHTTLSCFVSQGEAVLGDQSLFLSHDSQKLLWFLLPSEAEQNLVGVSSSRLRPFTPKSYENKEDAQKKLCLEEQNSQSPGLLTSSVDIPFSREHDFESSFDKEAVLEANELESVNQNDVTVANVKFCHPPKAIFKPTAEAIQEFGMIEDGDRVLVCLSGGKDSLSLLHTLKQFQFVSKTKVSLVTGLFFYLYNVCFFEHH